VQFVDVADFFLLVGADDRSVLELRHCPAGAGLGWILHF
jgi:hypothetical protein